MEAVVGLSEAMDRGKYGGKAANLAVMLRAGLPVPPGFAISIDAFGKAGKLLKPAEKDIKSHLKLDKVYAVRSSATVEDSIGASWAGQFDTFLDVKSTDIAAKVQEVHNSTKARAKAYASDKVALVNIAVVIQEMVEPTYAGIIFTKDPSTGANTIVIEYVKGLGEALVHGDADPGRIVWSRRSKKIKEQTEQIPPIPINELVDLGERIEKLFDGMPQDIEWAYDGKQVWIVQSRPITTLQERGQGKHYLGDPEKLFYWGPTRAQPLFMSDFVQSVGCYFDAAQADSNLPEHPKIIILFWDAKMVWLCKAADWFAFCNKAFNAYEQNYDIARNKEEWHASVAMLDDYFADAKVIEIRAAINLLEATWKPTHLAEFALYGAESVIHERLARFDEKARQEIWGGMTLPDKPTFIQRIDEELLATADPVMLAVKYPWIQDGYYGVSDKPKQYFTERLKLIKDNGISQIGSVQQRNTLVQKFKLKPNEIRALDLARELSVFMDERKAWMMRTRRYIEQCKQIAGENLGITDTRAESSTIERLASGSPAPYFGSTYLGGKKINLDKEDASLAWTWYVEFRASKAVLKGLTASSGGKHFINGDVYVAQSPYDPMPDEVVLVVPFTSPSYVPLMRRARALVTDHGGMMSHAAIVAREFGLPCIVSTKRATKVLKNGDKVVLDLVKGEVNR